MRERNRCEFGRKAMILPLIILGLTLPGLLTAQMTPRGMGFGGAYTAVARGVHAPAWNPANLGLPDNPRFSFTFVSAEAGIWNNSFTKAQYEKYNGAYWNRQDIEDILGSIPDGGLTADVRAFTSAFSFSTGRFAMNLGGYSGSYATLDKTVFDLSLQGNKIGETYRLDELDGMGMGIGVLGFSWGQPVPVSFARNFALGATIRFVYGGGYASPQSLDATLTTADYGMVLDAEYDVKYALGGLGWGVDVGAAAQFGKKITVSLSLGDLVGNIPWNRDVTIEQGYMRGDSLGVVDFDDDVADSSWTLDGTSFSDKPPVCLRLGAAYQEGQICLALDYQQGFRDGAWISKKPRFSIGTEWSGLSWLPLRMGVILGGRIGFGTAFGIGIRPGKFVMDIGIINRGFITPGSSKGLIVGIELGLNFNAPREMPVLRVEDL